MCLISFENFSLMKTKNYPVLKKFDIFMKKWGTNRRRRFLVNAKTIFLHSKFWTWNFLKVLGLSLTLNGDHFRYQAWKDSWSQCKFSQMPIWIFFETEILERFRDIFLKSSFVFFLFKKFGGSTQLWLRNVKKL